MRSEVTEVVGHNAARSGLPPLVVSRIVDDLLRSSRVSFEKLVTPNLEHCNFYQFPSCVCLQIAATVRTPIPYLTESECILPSNGNNRSLVSKESSGELYNVVVPYIDSSLVDLGSGIKFIDSPVVRFHYEVQLPLMDGRKLILTHSHAIRVVTRCDKHVRTVDVVKGDIIDTRSSCQIHSKWIRFDPPSPMVVPNATNYINSTLVAERLRVIFNSTGLSDRVRQTDSDTLNTIREQMGNAAATEDDIIQRLDRLESESLLTVIFEFIKSA